MPKIRKVIFNTLDLSENTMFEKTKYLPNLVENVKKTKLLFDKLGVCVRM
jgi:hypothetical protein